MNGTADSIDGRSFWFEAPLADALPIGAYVTINVEPYSRFLGRVLEEAEPAPRSVSTRW